MSKNRRVAIIGRSESGKTSRAIGYSRGLWRTQRLRSLVFDPYKHENDWGPQAWVTSDFSQWKRVVGALKGCAAIWDETTDYGGRDSENRTLFTAIRHNHPVLIAVGHAHTSLLPPMRNSLTDLVLSRVDKDEADEWAKIVVDDGMKAAPTLAQYAWLHKRPFQPVTTHTEGVAELNAGIPL